MARGDGHPKDYLITIRSSHGQYNYNYYINVIMLTDAPTPSIPAGKSLHLCFPWNTSKTLIIVSYQSVHLRGYYIVYDSGGVH